MTIAKIISGGQTGADRAALDWAIRNSVPHGGWCPRNRKAEDGRIPDGYVLKQTPSFGYSERTKWNVCDSDGTVVFTMSDNMTGASASRCRMFAWLLLGLCDAGICCRSDLVAANGQKYLGKRR